MGRLRIGDGNSASGSGRLGSQSGEFQRHTGTVNMHVLRFYLCSRACMQEFTVQRLGQWGG